MISRSDGLPKLIIFDCDGVLVDTEPVANRVLQRAIASLGHEMAIEEIMERFIGRSMASIIKDIAVLTGKDVPESWIDKIRRDTITAFEQEKIEAIPYVREAIEALHELSVKTCVASSGIPVKMDITLGMAGLKHLFEGRIYSAIMVENGKPAPDLFLYAAQQFDIVPDACVVIEDSRPGVEAARAAGMRCLGFSVRGQEESLTEAGAEVFSEMRQLCGLLGL